MANFYKLSIITPTFNAGDHIENCIRSILPLVQHQVEHIVIDGGSTDQTISILKKHKHVKWFSEPDCGVYDAMNKGIKIASGNWIYFLGADDIITNAFSIFLDKVEEEYDIVYGNVQIKETGLLYGKEYQIKDLIRSNPCHQAILYKKVIFEKFGIFNIKYPILSDWDKNIQLWSKIGIKKQYFNICIATFSQAGLSSKYFDDIFWNDAFQKFLVIQSVSKTEAAEAMYPYIIFLAKNGVLFKTIRLALKYSFLSRQKFILFDALSLLMKKMLDES